MPRSSDQLTIVLAAGLVIAAIAAVLLGWFCYRLLIDRGRLLLRLPDEEASDARSSGQTRGLPPGAFLSDLALPAHASSAQDTGNGAIVTLSDLTGQPLLLVFLRRDCLFSRAFARELAHQPRGASAPLSVLVISGDIDDPEMSASFAALPGVVLLDPHGQVARLMRVAATPSGYLVDDRRRTVGRRLDGPLDLLAAARGDAVAGPDVTPTAVTPHPDRRPTRAPLPLGSTAPEFTLPLATGGEWSLGAHLGTPLTLLFSDPACPPCGTLLATLNGRDESSIVIVSRGDGVENRLLAEATGVTAPVLLQQQREVARLYHTLETPAAFAINEQGELAAGPAIGNEAVLGLIAEMESGKMRIDG